MASRLQSLSHRCNVTSLCLEIFSNEFSTLVPRFHAFKRSTKLAARSHYFTPEIDRCNLSSILKVSLALLACVGFLLSCQLYDLQTS